MEVLLARERIALIIISFVKFDRLFSDPSSSRRTVGKASVSIYICWGKSVGKCERIPETSKLKKLLKVRKDSE